MIIKTTIEITDNGEQIITNESDMNIFIYVKINESNEELRRVILPHSTLLLERNEHWRLDLSNLYFNENRKKL